MTNLLTQSRRQLAAASELLNSVSREIDSVIFCKNVVVNPGDQCALNEQERVDQLVNSITQLEKIIRKV